MEAQPVLRRSTVIGGHRLESPLLRLYVVFQILKMEEEMKERERDAGGGRMAPRQINHEMISFKLLF